MDVRKAAEELQPHLVELRRDFHAHPETSGNEKETAARVVKELESIGGYNIRTGVNGTNGVLAEIQGAKPGKTIALRADMDALSVTESTGLPCASVNPGIMHACGHDNHITMLLGAARLLRLSQGELKGTVRLIFQPSEEKAPTGGSRTMIAGGALENVDAVYGLHVWPNLPSGVLGVRDDQMMASSDHWFAHIEGASSHGAQPDQGRDALVAGTQFLQVLQTIVSRNTDPLKSAVITVGLFRAGERYNVVPGSCDMEGTVRTYDPDVRKMVERRIGEALDGVCRALGCEGKLTYEHGYCSLQNHEANAAFMRKTYAKLFGAKSVVVPRYPSMTAEDFAFYVAEKPGAFGWLGTTPEGETVWPLHSSHYAPDENVLWKGAALLAQMAIDS